MTVTYRRPAETIGEGGRGGGPAKERSGSANDGGSSRARLCRSCGTSFDVRIEAPETAVFDVRGGTCVDCNPYRRPAPDPPCVDRLVTIIPIRPSGGPSRVETLSEDVGDTSAMYHAEHIVQTPRREATTETTKRINAAWRRAVEPIVSAGLGEEDWRAIDRVWQAELCEWVEAVAAALDDVWASTVPMAESTRVVLHLPGLPAVVAALLLRVAQRSLTTVHEPVAMTGSRLRSAGIACCAATGRALTCGRLRHEIETVSENPDPGVLRVISERLDRALVPVTPEFGVADHLQRLAARPHRPTVRTESSVGSSACPMGSSLAAIARSTEVPQRVAIFGESC